MRGVKISIEEFKERASSLHKNQYDYSSVLKIKNGKEKIGIMCLKHGLFLQRISSHLEGYGCKECSDESQRGNIEDFIKKSQQVHGNMYDYSKTDYLNSFTKVEIVCKNHGSFWQSPDNHYAAAGCPACGKVKRVTFEDFVSRARDVHGDKYSYDNVVWNNISNKIEILCDKKHSFKQTPSDHLNRHGCPFCRHIVSYKEEKWLDAHGIPRRPENRQVKIKLKDGSRVSVDGYRPETKTVYEFLGDFFHGNPKVYDLQKINPLIGKTFDYLFEKTKKRLKKLEENGYNTVCIWESDYKDGENI